MEVDEQDREQMDSERERDAREKGRRQNKETTNTQTCGDICMSDFLPDTRCDTLSHNVMCAQNQICRGKVSCEVYLSTRHHTTEFIRNSVPHDFFEAAWILVVSLPTQWAIHFRQFLVMPLSYAHELRLYIKVACDIEVSGTTSTTFSK